MHTCPGHPVELLTRVARLAARAEGPITMLTLLDDWLSLVLPASAAESPEMTRALEKPLLPKRKLRVELVDEPRLDLTSASARSRTLRWPVLVTGGGCVCRDGAEVRKDRRLPARRGARPWADADVCRTGWRLSGIGPDVLRAGGLWPSVPCAWMDRLRPFLLPLKESGAGCHGDVGVCALRRVARSPWARGTRGGGVRWAPRALKG